MFEKLFNHLKVDLKNKEPIHIHRVVAVYNVFTDENIKVGVSYDETVRDDPEIIDMLGHELDGYSLLVAFYDEENNKQYYHEVLLFEGVPFFVGAYDSEHKGTDYLLEYMINNPTVFKYDGNDIDFDDKTIQFNINVLGNHLKTFEQFKSMIDYITKYFEL